MSVRAKMKCESVAASAEPSGCGTVRLSPVTHGSPENDRFFQYTPGGKLVLSQIQKSAFDQFAIGREYYVDVTPANLNPPTETDVHPFTPDAFTTPEAAAVPAADVPQSDFGAGVE